jgi:hypothetical protein
MVGAIYAGSATRRELSSLRWLGNKEPTLALLSALTVLYAYPLLAVRDIAATSPRRSPGTSPPLV